MEAYRLAAVSLLSVALVCFGSRLRGETSRYGKPPRLLLLRLFFSPHFCFHFIFIFIFVGLFFVMGLGEGFIRGVVLLGVMGFGEGFCGFVFCDGFWRGICGVFFL